MLRELHIQNLAVIEDLTIEFGAGLNCFTGQTGAGKSLILGAFEILLGLRQGADMLRPGAEEARVWGVFEVHDDATAKELSELLDATVLAGEDLLVTRRVFASGRTSASVNGRPATGPMVRSVGELLVDIHGQHDHQFLLKPSNQLSIIDSFAKALGLRETFGKTYTELRELVQRKRELAAGVELRRQQLELFEFQANEIDEAELVAGEFEELRQRNALLGNIEKIKREAAQAHGALYEADGAVVERLQMIAHLLSELAMLDEEISPIAEQVKGAAMTLQESAFDLGRYINRLDFDPAEAAEIDERLNTVNRMIAKYGKFTAAGEDPVAEVLSIRADLAKKIEASRSQDNDLESIDEQATAIRAKMGKIGRELSEARKAAATKIKPLIEKQLRELGMVDAEFFAEFTPADSDTAGETGMTGSPTGLESVEMMVCTNPGQPTRPLRKIASGGELSRIMLALKSILAESDRVSVLVFDEIDSNIGGRMGTVIGQKLHGLANGTSLSGKKSVKTSTHQVLCITHLPQIAAFADRHFRIAKAVAGEGKEKATRTVVTQLQGEQRVEELAEMLTGKNVTETTRAQVKEMIASAGQG